MQAIAGFDVCPDLPPVIAVQAIERGWRGITADGEILNVANSDQIPDSISISHNGHPLGFRAVSVGNVVDIEGYLAAFNTATQLTVAGRDVEALASIDAAISIASTLRARYNRSMILLALGRWQEGFAEYELLERQPPFQRGRSRAALDAGVTPWHGEPLEGKRLLLVHDHGLGDTLMMLRYIAPLRALGADIVAWVPQEIVRIVSQFVTPVSEPSCKADYFVQFLQLLRWFEATTTSVPPTAAVALDPGAAARYFPINGRRRIGIAWSVGRVSQGDFPRPLPLVDLLRHVDHDAELHSVQIQNADEAAAHGVITHDFFDLADCASLMTQMDEIVTIDTAAVHLALAIGHPNVRLLLSRWHSWRWKFGSPFYPGVRIEPSGR